MICKKVITGIANKFVEGELKTFLHTVAKVSIIALIISLPTEVFGANPVADPGGPYVGETGKAVSFDGSGSFDTDGEIVTYHWIFGDGHFITAENPSHIYTSPGTYDVTLLVRDNDGNITNATTTATLEYPPPSYLSIFPASGELATTFRFDVGLIVDAPGLSITGGSAILDGTDVTASLVSCIVPGTLLSGGQTLRCPGMSGKFLGAGTHTFNVNLELNSGQTISDTVEWEVFENKEH